MCATWSNHHTCTYRAGIRYESRLHGYHKHWPEFITFSPRMPVCVIKLEGVLVVMRWSGTIRRRSYRSLAVNLPRHSLIVDVCSRNLRRPLPILLSNILGYFELVSPTLWEDEAGMVKPSSWAWEGTGRLSGPEEDCQRLRFCPNQDWDQNLHK